MTPKTPVAGQVMGPLVLVRVRALVSDAVVSESNKLDAAVLVSFPFTD